MTNNQYKLLFSIRNKTIELLKGYGNEPSEQHELAIEKLASQISFIAYSNIPIRLAAPLETGMGKTTTIIAALLCMENTDRSALVCVETLDQQRELHEACINAGISSNKISKDPLDEISVNWMNTFNGEERSIVFWDERLEPKSCFTLFKSEIRSALGAWLPLYEEKIATKASYYQEIDQLLHHEIPQSEEVLLFTFKGILEEVKNHFNQDKYFHRVHVTHWGMHKASNRYSHIKYMATLGIMRRNAADLIANILGAKDDIGSTVTAKELQAVEHTEMADMLIQAIGRGHNRVTKSGGIAGDTAIWL